MTKREHIDSLLAKRDLRLFMEGGCHVFAEALRKRFGYSCFAIRRGPYLNHVYCHGTTLAVDFTGRKHEDHILDEFVHFEGGMGYNRELALRFRVPFQMTDAQASDRGLLTDPKFLSDAMSLAEQHIDAHIEEYKDA